MAHLRKWGPFLCMNEAIWPTPSPGQHTTAKCTVLSSLSPWQTTLLHLNSWSSPPLHSATQLLQFQRHRSHSLCLECSFPFPHPLGLSQSSLPVIFLMAQVRFPSFLVLTHPLAGTCLPDASGLLFLVLTYCAVSLKGPPLLLLAIITAFMWKGAFKLDG
jgi:hypothetical protein